MLTNIEDKYHVWSIVMSSLIGRNSMKLRCNRSGHSYNRDLLFALLRDYLTQMTEMNRKLRKFKRYKSRLRVLQKMCKLFGQELVLKAWKYIENDPAMMKLRGIKQVKIIDNVNRQITRWKPSDNNLHIRMIITLEWERYKEHIIENIIEPYLKLRGGNVHHHRYPAKMYNKQHTSSSASKERVVMKDETPKQKKRRHPCKKETTMDDTQKKRKKEPAENDDDIIQYMQQQLIMNSSLLS